MNKKGSAFELAQQMILYIPRILLIMFAMVIILTPISCYINRSVVKGDIEPVLVMKKAVSCLEREGFDEKKLGDCMKQDVYGISLLEEAFGKSFSKTGLSEKTSLLESSLEKKTAEGSIEKLGTAKKEEKKAPEVEEKKESREIIFNKQKYLEKTYCKYEGWHCLEKTRIIGDKEYTISVVVEDI